MDKEQRIDDELKILEELINVYEVLPSDYFVYKNNNLTNVEETIKYNKNKEK